MATTPELLALNIELYLEAPEPLRDARQAVGEFLVQQYGITPPYPISPRLTEAEETRALLDRMTDFPDEFDPALKIEIIRRGLSFRLRDRNWMHTESFRRFCRQYG